MSAKVDEPSAADPHNVEISTTTTSNGSASGPRVSKFAAKSGFVIPKNKLSGSLVPIFKGGKRAGTGGAVGTDESMKTQRKTKWDPDLTQDSAVRRGRALAYQTRVDQIMQQLKLEVLEPVENQDSELSDQLGSSDPPSSRIDNKSKELLEFEWREIIGEILKLNPNYKAPPEYKPLLKEDFVTIPVKAYPGYNFVGLIFGSGSETQKRLEKETGAKLQIYGTRSDTGHKIEISPSDAKETNIAFEELSVCVSADTVEKVDSAVSVIELLIASVLENLAATDKEKSATPNQLTSMNFVEPTQTPNQLPGSEGVSHQTAMHKASSFLPFPNSSPAPQLINTGQLSTVNSSPMPTLFVRPPLPASGFNMIPAGQPPPVQVSPSSYPPRSISMPAMQASSYTGGQSRPVARPLMPQPVPTVPTRSMASGSLQSHNFPMHPQHGHQPMLLQPDFRARPFNLPLSGGPISRPLGSPTFANAPSSHMGPSSVGALVQSPAKLPNSSVNFVGPSSLSSPTSNIARVVGPQDFTFQPNLASQTVPQPGFPPPHMMQPSAPQASSLQFLRANPNQLDGRAFPRMQVGYHMGQNQGHPSEVPLMGNLHGSSVAPRTPGFPQPSPMSQFGPRNFSQASQMPGFPSSFPPRPVQPQNYPVAPEQRRNFMPANQPISISSRNVSLRTSRPSSLSPVGRQIYDPFLPSSVSGVPKGQDQAKASKQESGPVHKDPMPSVGAK